jgi:RimJ/RimL family protein N-acetyltransferase
VAEGSGVAISRIRSDEWRVLKDLRLAALRDAPYAFSARLSEAEAQPDDFWQTAAADRAAAPDSCTFFARAADGTPVGMAGGFRDGEFRDVAHLVAVWVAPDWRGAGVAAPLVEAVCAWAVAPPGASRVTAYVSEGNARALRFYEKIGFIRQPPDALRPGHFAAECDILTVKAVAPTAD